MSTRAMICVDWNGHDHFELFYRHCDGYPTGLGTELIEAMLKHESIEEVLRQVDAEPVGRSIGKIEDAFLKVQSDLEWIYAICNANDPETVSLQIFKTSNPYTKRDFIWPVWFSYKTYIKRKKALSDMSMVELTASSTLHALHEFEKAESGGDSEKPKDTQESVPGESRQSNEKDNTGRAAASAQDQVARFTACVFEPTDMVEVRRLPSGKSTWCRASVLSDVAESLLGDNRRNQHIYVGANPRRAKGGTKSKDVACGRCLFVDFDGTEPGQARARWEKADLPAPTLTIGSGHGVHAYWRLGEPIVDLALWSKIQKKLIALLDSDPAIHDPARIMRLPGFTNHKEPVAVCRILDSDPTRTYHLKSLMPILRRATTKLEYSSRPGTGLTARPKPALYNNLSIVDRAALTASRWKGAPKGQRNARAFQNAAYLLKNLGLAEEQAWAILRAWNRKNRPPLPEHELRQALQNANIYGRHSAATKKDKGD